MKFTDTTKSFPQFFLDHYPKNKYELITPVESRANILCLRGKNIDPLNLERELKFRNLDVSVRQGNVRLSFHLFNNKEQVETLIKAAISKKPCLFSFQKYQYHLLPCHDRLCWRSRKAFSGSPSSFVLKGRTL